MDSIADIIISNAKIYTLDRDRSWAEALAIKDDRIIYVGSNEGVSDYEGRETKVIDAGDRLVLPAFIDPHTHLIDSYSKLVWADLSPAKNLGDLLDILGKYYLDNPDRDFIGGFGWSYDIFRSSDIIPNRSILDDIIPDKPVWIVDDTGHTALANTIFIELAREKLSEEELRYGGMEIDEVTGEPTGIFIDCFNLPLNKIIDLDRDRILGLLKGMDMAVRFGISTVLDAMVDDEGVELYRRLEDEGRLKIRVHMAYYYSEKTADRLSWFKEVSRNLDGEWLRGNSIKLFLDGIVETHTAALYESYRDDPSNRGALLYEYDLFKETVKKIDDMGFQIITHALGDYAVKVVLDAYEYLGERGDISDKRHRIEHVEFIHPDDLRRLRKINPVIVMNPSHASISSSYIYYVGDIVERSFTWRSIAETGVKLAFASDWPVVGLNPIIGIHDAVNREGYPYGKGEELDVKKAVECYTIDAAYALFRERELGSIEVGKKADIIILSQNIFEIDSKKIKDTKVLLTLVNGKILYRDPGFKI